MAIKSKVVREVPHKSGFDKSFRNLLTAPVGTLVPVLVDEVIPGSNVHLKALVSGSMAPLATDTFMNVEYRMEAFFVPYRILYKGFEDWLTQNENVYLDDISKAAVPTLPSFMLHNNDGGFVEKVGPGTLLDYLGYKDLSASYPRDYTQRINIFPMLAYHKIYSDHYRNALVQKDCFAKPFVTTGYDLQKADYLVAALPYIAFDPALSSVPTISEYEYNSENNSYDAIKQGTLADGVKISELRQRNFDNDYFTMAQPTPQQGNEQRVQFSTSGETGSFTIAQLRMANSLQQFAELNSLAGPRLVDYVKAHYGANLSDGVAQRSIYLGRQKITIYSKGIYQSQNNTVVSDSATRNPFATVGAQYGSPFFADSGDLIDNFEVNEPGVIMVLGSVVPRVTYSSGVARYLTHHYVSDESRVNIADPLLQNVGNQPIFKQELDGFTDNSVFGYIDRFAEWMCKNDEVHGLIRDGQSLSAFALQRTFTNDERPEISSEFLQIPRDFMNQVFAVFPPEGTPSYNNFVNLGAWIDHFFEYKVAMPLAEYSLPTLQDPAYEHGRSVVIDRSGSHL